MVKGKKSKKKNKVAHNEKTEFKGGEMGNKKEKDRGGVNKGKWDYAG